MFRYVSLSVIVLILLSACGSGNINRGSGEPKIADPPAILKASISDPPSREIVCLIYHRFGEPRYPSTNISISLFDQHLKYLVDHNFRILTLGEALQFINENTVQEQKMVVITIDDAFQSFMQNALPLLRKYQVKATLFVNTETVGTGDYLKWEDMQELVREGIEIGNHTHTHAYFLNLLSGKNDSLRNEINKSQYLIKTHLDVEPRLFAYPYGEYDSSMKSLVRTLNFKGAAAQYSGILTEKTDLYCIPRFPMTDQFGSLDKFIEKVNLKSLRVISAEPSNTLFVNNPPELKLIIFAKDYDTGRLSFFIQGGIPVITKTCTDSLCEVTIVAEQPLKSRRTLYTITVPSKTSSTWYWYSHLWINPAIKE